MVVTDSVVNALLLIAIGWMGALVVGQLSRRRVTARDVAVPRPAAPPAVTATLPSAELAMLLIKARRSVKPKDMNASIVAKTDIEAMLEAANWAPSHGLTEPWRFVVLDRAACGELINMRVRHLERTIDGPELAKRVAKVESKRGDLQRVSHFIAIVSKRVPNAKGRMMPEWEDVRLPLQFSFSFSFSLSLSLSRSRSRSLALSLSLALDLTPPHSLHLCALSPSLRMPPSLALFKTCT